MRLRDSEFILNPDRSIYHLNLHPEDLADTVITVGDPGRVKKVSAYFDSVEIRKGKREFLTHTGYLNKKKLTVISTGIGTDNIDIVMNELDALVNIDFQSRVTKPVKRQLTIVRIGTSGAIQENIEPGGFVLSDYAIGLDGLLHFYKHPGIRHRDIEDAFVSHTGWGSGKAAPYVVRGDSDLIAKMKSSHVRLGFTASNAGFYGPQGRQLRLELSDSGLADKIAGFQFRDLRITNMEMETSAIYALSGLLGYRAVSLNCILANRATGAFSKSPDKAVDALIQYTLEKLTS